MEAARRKRGLLTVGLLLLGLLVTVVLWYLMQDEEPAQVTGELTITESGFYDKDLSVKVEVPQGAKVYYTDDCSVPTVEAGQLYEGPITLAVTEPETVYVLRFKAVYPDERETEVITKTYILGENVTNRYCTTVLSVVGDPDGLFGYENGIFVKGKRFDEWKAANPDTFYGGGVDANFEGRGPEYERAVHVEYFTKEGKSLFEVDGGVRLHGAFTRMKNQKSFRLYARKEYDDKNEFEYPVVDALKNADGTVFDRYKRLLVRNSGNDNGFAFIRNELGCELANDAGFQDVWLSEPTVVYLNGIYYGQYWIGNNFDRGYFEEKYGEFPGQFVVLEGKGGVKEDDEDPIVQEYVDEYNALFHRFYKADLTDDAVYNELCKVLDVENYLQYCAIELYLGNVDWPGNNVKVYRYVSPTDEYVDGTVYDGRYRNLLYDLDMGLGLLLLGGGGDETDRSLNINLKSQQLLLGDLVKREDCRNYFLNYMCDLMSGPMSAENMIATLEEKHASRQPELYHMLEETDLMQDSLWNWENASIYYDEVEKNYAQIVKFAQNRRANMLNDIIASFGFNAVEAYTLYVKTGSIPCAESESPMGELSGVESISYGTCLSGVQLNTMLIEEPEYNGVYFGNIPITLSPVLASNETFRHWVVNGEVREGDVLTLTTKDIVEAQIHVEMVTASVEAPLLSIHAVRAKGSDDFVELVNYSAQMVSTNGYYLTDNEDKYRFALPKVLLQPGEVIRFYGQDATELESLGKWTTNFNLKMGEELRLHYGEDLIDTLMIPDLTRGGVYTKNQLTGKYAETRRAE